MAKVHYEYEKRKDQTGYVIWKVEPSLSGEAGPTRTIVGYAGSVKTVKRYYPNAVEAK